MRFRPNREDRPIKRTPILQGTQSISTKKKTRLDQPASSTRARRKILGLRPDAQAGQISLLKNVASLLFLGLLVALILGQLFADPNQSDAFHQAQTWLLGLALGLELAVWLLAQAGRAQIAILLQSYGALSVLIFSMAVFGGAGSSLVAAISFLIALATLILDRRKALVFSLACLLAVLALAWLEASAVIGDIPLVQEAGTYGTSMGGAPPLEGVRSGQPLPWPAILQIVLMTALMQMAAQRMGLQAAARSDEKERARHLRREMDREISLRTAEMEAANARLQREVDERGAALAARSATANRLRKTQQRLDAILEYLPQLVLYETREGHGSIIGNIEGLLGYAPEHFSRGQGFFLSLIHPEDAGPVRRAYENWNAGGRRGVLSQEFRCLRRDGRYVWLQDFAVRVVPPEGADYIAGVMLDVSERRKAEEERRHFSQQLRTAAETAERLNAILDPQLLMDETVQLMQSRFGLYHVHFYLLDATGTKLNVRAASGEVGRALIESDYEIALDAEQSIVAYAARQGRYVLAGDVNEDSRYLPHPLLPNTRSEVAIPLLSREGVIGVLDVQDDEPHRFSASDLDTYSTLAGQIAVSIENARVFNEMQAVMARLREVDRLKTEFLANMSHELRTPLNSIIGYAELILLGINGEHDEETRDDIQAIFDNGQQLLKLINDLLDLAKIEAGRMRLEKEPIDIADLLETVRTRNAGLLLRKPVQLLVEVEPDLPALPADRLRLEQVMGNLVSNAVKFTEEGQILLRASKDGAYMRLDVDDTGAGIEDEVLEDIFDKFRQADGSFTRRAKGTGLGLAITRHLVEMHGGTIEVSSEMGRGSTFSVRMPFDAGKAELLPELDPNV